MRKKSAEAGDFGCRVKQGGVSSSVAGGLFSSNRASRARIIDLQINIWEQNVLSDTSTSIKFNTFIKNCLHQRTPWHYRAGRPGQTPGLLLKSLTGKQKTEEEEMEWRGMRGLLLEADGSEEGRKMKRTSFNGVHSFDDWISIYNQINFGFKPFQVCHQS